MIKIIDIKELYSKNSEIVSENEQTINRILVSRIINLSLVYKFYKIRANPKIVARLQDTSNYIFFPVNRVISFTGGLIHYGRISNIDIYLDSNMAWDDNRIIPIYDNSVLRSNKINKIRGKEIKFDILEYLKIENLEI